MKVIHVAWDAEKYGVGTFLFDLVSDQNNSYRDIKADVVFHKTNKEGERKYCEKGIKYFSLGVKSALDIRLLYKFYNIFRSYDIINLHTHSPLALLAGKIADVKIIYTYHGYAGIKKSWISAIVRWFHRVIMVKFCDYYTFASRSSFQRYLRDIAVENLDRIKYRIYPYGVRIKEIKAQESRFNIRSSFGWHSKFLIGTAARMDPNKRLEYLIYALAGLAKREDYMLVFAGTGNMDYEFFLKNLVQQYRLSDCVQFLGYCENIYDVINALDIFVLPSKEEPFGIALLEAMALGIPAIVFKDGGGAVDILAESGIKVTNVKELQRAIRELKNDSKLRGQIGMKEKVRSQMFDISNTAQSFYEIYRNLLR